MATLSVDWGMVGGEAGGGGGGGDTSINT